MIQINRLTEASDRTARELSDLLVQLTKKAWPLTTERLEQMLAAPTRVFVALDGEKIVGAAMLIIVYQLKDTKAWLEDVVVNEDYRGQGIAKQLTAACLEAAREAGVRSVNLTSGTQREAAHKLYEKMGFKLRDTKVYRLPLTDTDV